MAAPLATAQIAQSAGTLGAPPTRLATKTCPDGSVLLETDQCMTWPDHRYLYSLEPVTSTLTARWWCRDEKQPSAAEIKISEKVIVAEDGRTRHGSAFDIELIFLRIEGKQAPRQSKAKVEETLRPFKRVSGFKGRCRYSSPKSPGRMEPLLLINGSDSENRAREVEIPLR